MHVYVGGGGKRRIYNTIQDFDEFHVVSNIFVWLPVYSLCKRIQGILEILKPHLRTKKLQKIFKRWNKLFSIYFSI